MRAEPLQKHYSYKYFGICVTVALFKRAEIAIGGGRAIQRQNKFLQIWRLCKDYLS
jgi:hypothetical protein